MRCARPCCPCCRIGVQSVGINSREGDGKRREGCESEKGYGAFVAGKSLSLSVTNCLVFLMYTSRCIHVHTHCAAFEVESATSSLCPFLLPSPSLFSLSSMSISLSLLSLASGSGLSLLFIPCSSLSSRYLPDTRPTCKSCRDLVYLRDPRRRARFPN